ncbi:transglycosylase SLT domain-containing protein [Psychrobacter sp. Marseille-P5312]|uniref:transglycosylase SLT domain-containing protein n=1 Tax=Psychrobacter sp. Marseille-P5312 TaxID=2086574 RepID=UPI000CF61EAB|nr:transglycosylase SLT domain-containing protein [Psychrobacter sp. Marseille-P5312]
MSSLTGIAQFTNRFAQNIMGYNQDKKDEAERVADKQYNRNRQQQQDLRAQQNHDVNLEGKKITLNQNKIKNDEFNDSVTFEETRNKLAYLDGIGADEQQKVDVLAKAVNSNNKLPYKIEFERDATTGKIIQRQGPDGKPFYFQTIIDKETGQELGRKGTTFEEATSNYNKLQNAGAIEDEIRAAAAARAAKAQEIEDKLTLKRGEAAIDDAKDASKQRREHIYKVDEMGVKHGYTIDELGVKHGFLIDELGVRHANAVDLANVNAQNNIGIRTAQSDLDAGGTPIVGGAAWGSFDALIGPESNGRQLNSKGQPLTSSAGAIGIAQVMPETAKYVARKHGIAWDANKYKTDPSYNYNLGKLYYQEQLDKYGHPALAYAAYNAGPGAVDKWIKKNPAMRNPDAMGMQNFINAIPFSETKNYVAKIHRQSNGVQVQRSVPAVPKLPKGSSKQGNSGKGIVTAQDYNVSIDKGVNTAIKDAKQLGIKSDAATTAAFARAGTKLKEMGRAQNEQEFLDLYGDAFDLVISAVPERTRNKMSKADKNALGHKVLLSMVGASSLGNLKQIVYKINPNARGGGNTVTAGGLTLPGQQPTPLKQTAQTPQTSKLKALYARGLPAPQTDPAAAESFDYMNNLNDNMDW